MGVQFYLGYGSDRQLMNEGVVVGEYPNRAILSGEKKCVVMRTVHVLHSQNFDWSPVPIAGAWRELSM